MQQKIEKVKSYGCTVLIVSLAEVNTFTSRLFDGPFSRKNVQYNQFPCSSVKSLSLFGDALNLAFSQTKVLKWFLINLICPFIYFGFYIAFNTVQVISRRVVGRAEESSTYS